MVKGSFSVRLPEFARTTTFRWTLAISGAFTLCVILMFVFVLGEEYSYLSSDVDRLNSENARLVTAETKENRVRRLNEYLIPTAIVSPATSKIFQQLSRRIRRPRTFP